MVRVTALRWVPPFAQGLVRDFRVRWALEEVGVPYDVRLLDLKEIKQDGHRQLQPFGQVPVYEEEGLVLFESGAIVLHIAEKSPTLLPTDSRGRERARQWLFAALNSVEQHINTLISIDVFFKNEEWAKMRRPSAVETLKTRLGELSKALGDREYLDDRFTVGDLMMSSVLRILRGYEDLVPANLAAYRERCEARPAFKRAIEDQMKPFRENAPKADN